MMGNSGPLGVLFVDSGENSEKLLEKLGNLRERLQVIDISKNGVRGWLLLEYGTMEVPLLVTDRIVLSDAESIVEFVRKSAGGE